MDNASENTWSGVVARSGKMVFTRSAVLATEARKAGIDKSLARRVPIPPYAVGREACIHLGSSKDTLRIFSRLVWTVESKASRNTGSLQVGAHLRR
jgi:hypothetical protein